MYAQTTEALLKAYLEVCNQALERNRDRFPFKQILGAAQKSGGRRLVEVHLSDDPNFSYVMTIKDGQIISYPHDDCENCNCDKKWVADSVYMQHVAAHPDIYI